LSGERWDLVCTAVPFGYGPSAKAVAVGSRACALGMRVAFMGSGIAFELAQRSECFCECIRVDLATPSYRRALRSVRTVLCVMDSRMAREAQELGCEVTVADSLFWLWDRVPDEYLAANAYFVQAFVGVSERAYEHGGRPMVVGPIVDEPVRGDTRSRRLVINLGGVESPLSTASRDPYGELVVTAVGGSKLREAYRGRIVVIAGSGCICSFADQLAAAGLAGASLSAEAARDEIARADLVVTSPGLTTTLGAFAASVPTVFLPPQNYSQWLILSEMRKLGLAPNALHWHDVDAHIPIRARMAEGHAGEEVLRAIARLARKERVRAALRMQLDDVLSIDLFDLAARQHKWYETLGANGADTIARHLARAEGGRR
jgi:hypothetical protein